MIENFNSSTVSSGASDIKKYIGVATISVLAVNPNNETLRHYGWKVQEGAEEPHYSTISDDGKPVGRVRFLCQIHDLKEKPVVPIDFWCRPNFIIGKNTGKCKVIDSYGRVAWATKDEIKTHAIPQYSSGPASIAPDYKPCHPGQDKLIAFLYKLMNITPFMVMNRDTKEWEKSKNPGRITIDEWNSLCAGDVKEIEGYLKLRPDNRMKVILGVKTTDENNTYQTFLDVCDGTKNIPYFNPNSKIDQSTGEYPGARKRIDAYYQDYSAGNISFSAAPVTEWKETATEVKDNSEVTMFDDDGNFVANDDGDLPFA